MVTEGGFCVPDVDFSVGCVVRGYLTPKTFLIPGLLRKIAHEVFDPGRVVRLALAHGILCKR